jgi:PAS domain S-box-containing protein
MMSQVPSSGQAVEPSDLETVMAVLANAPGIVVWTDPGGVIRWISRADGGFRAEEVVGRRWEDFLDAAQVAEVETALARSVQAPQSIELSLVTPDGATRRYLTRSAPAALGGASVGHIHVVSELSGATKDLGLIAERQRAAALLQAQARRTAQILETMHDGYLLVGDKGIILDVNAAYAELVGRDRDEILGTPLAELTVESAEVERLLRGDRQRFETCHRHASGAVVDLEVSASTMIVDDMPVATMFLRDVTARNRTERARREYEGEVRHRHKLEALGTLASGVAHEINNPIQGILGFAQLIQGRSNPSGDVFEFAGEIIVECGRIARIVSNLLAFARPDSDAQTPSEVAHLVLTTLSLLRPTLVKDGIAVETDLPEELPPIACRGDQIRQVVMNLLTNARDALNTRFGGSDPKKTMRIGARSFEEDGCEWVRIEVEDRGVGIAPEMIDRIFDPFFTTKEPDAGTGLGLAVSHRIVADHGGRLSVESEPLSYTRFSVELPIDAVDLTGRPSDTRR